VRERIICGLPRTLWLNHRLTTHLQFFGYRFFSRAEISRSASFLGDHRLCLARARTEGIGCVPRLISAVHAVGRLSAQSETRWTPSSIWRQKDCGAYSAKVKASNLPRAIAYSGRVQRARFGGIVLSFLFFYVVCADGSRNLVYVVPAAGWRPAADRPISEAGKDRAERIREHIIRPTAGKESSGGVQNFTSRAQKVGLERQVKQPATRHAAHARFNLTPRSRREYHHGGRSRRRNAARVDYKIRSIAC